MEPTLSYSMRIACRCGAINDFTVKINSNNHTAYCNRCGAYIKNIPHDVPKLYIGKYRGKPISEIDDLPYLEWAFKTLTLTESIRQSVADQINRLTELMK